MIPTLPTLHILLPLLRHNRDSRHGNRDFPLQISRIIPIFAVNKRRKELDMTTLMMILGACMVGLGIGLMDPGKRTSRTRKPKKKNFFVRLGESGNPKFNWMGGYTERD